MALACKQGTMNGYTPKLSKTMHKTTLWLLLLLALTTQGQQFSTPLVSSQYRSLSSNAGIMSFLDSLSHSSSAMHLDTAGYSANNKIIPLVRIQHPDQRQAVPWVFLFAQQHGDEPSGKEGLLLLAEDFVQGRLNGVLDSVNVLLMPQVNPDGGDLHQRRNIRNIDLNRDHLLMQAPETRAIHRLFEKYNPVMTVDIHEYYPYGDSWMEFGYRRDFDIQVGGLTNPNISMDLIRYQRNEVLPFIERWLEKFDYSFFEYTLGHFPSGERLRHSTTDINDGRQSLGITNTLSFIVEGMNGKDSTHNIRRRALSQYETAKAFCLFASENITRIAQKVEQAQKQIASRDSVTIRQDHFDGETVLNYPLKNVKTGQDTVFEVTNYHHRIKPLLKVETPRGYLIQKKDTTLVDLLKNNHLRFTSYEREKQDMITGRQIIEKNMVENEGLETPYPMIMDKFLKSIDPDDYYFVPADQLRKYKLVIAFEPQAMFGIGFYDPFSEWMQKNTLFPVLRVE